VGFKPSYEAISRAGVIPLSWSLDHVGPMARTVEDAAILFAAAGQEPRALRPHDEPLARDIGSLRLGVASAYLGNDVQPEIAAAVRAAVAHLSSTVRSVEEVSIPDDRQTVATWFSICMPEASAYHAATMKRCLQDYGEPLQDRLLAGLGIPGAQYVQAQRARHVIARQFAEVFHHVDVIALPTVQAEAPAIAEAMSGSWAGLRARLRSVAAFNVAGLPAATIPCGLTASGLPIGLQLVGAFQADWTVLRAAAAFEQSVGWNHCPEIW
jgi:aspartyl-tRNA(Asn)/glutamyl-tRNA(Gln) amidotransferase subunit A